MIEQSGIKLVTDLMQNSMTSSKLLARACFVLGNLAFHGKCHRIPYLAVRSMAREYCTDAQVSLETCKKVILQHGGIERTAQAMAAYPGNASLALEGCFLLSNMSVVKGEGHAHVSQDPTYTCH